MDTIEHTFYNEAIKAFAFLEIEYGYRRSSDISNEYVDWRDLQIDVVYLTSTIAINIFWIPTVSQVDVGFNELPDKWTLQSTPVAYFDNYSENNRGILLRMYTEMIGHSNDPDFLLKNQDDHSGRAFAQRKRIIQKGVQPIIEGLARATRRYAGPILLGDTSMFTKVREYTHNR